MSQADTFSLSVQSAELPEFEAWHAEKRDAVEFLRSLPPDSVNLIVTDIAYESLEKYRAVGTTTRLKKSKASSNEWFPIFPNARIPELFHECFRVLKRNSHFYFFSDAETMFVAKPMGEQAGFTFWKPIVWDYGVIGMGYHYRARHQFILFFEKGKRRIRDLGVPDVLCHRRVLGGYPTEKPRPLLEELVTQSSDNREIVLDPFMGSGSTGMAALGLGRRFIGCDTSDGSLERACGDMGQFAPEGRWAVDNEAPERPPADGHVEPPGWKKLEDVETP